MTELLAAGTAHYVWGVAALLRAAADALALRFGACSVRGELSGFSKAASGHCYFNLKDADRAEGALRCCLFRRSAGLVDFPPSDGQLVEVRGRLGVYGPRGELQLVVESMRRAGAGALYEQFLRLRERLEREGLFEPAHKRALPAFPQRIGLVTSTAGAAVHDVLTALARRAPQVEVLLYPSAVQGAEAPASLCAALALAGRRAEVDTLIVCRGGGSLEDLWAFNDERVVRAIRAAPMPVVCGVGHETDVSLADLAADLRAPTPTAAAELAAPARVACLAELASRESRLQGRMAQWLDLQAQRLDRVGLRLSRPAEGARRRRQHLELIEHRLRAAARGTGELRRARWAHLEARLQRSVAGALARQQAHLQSRSGRIDALDPRRVLARGYALLTDLSGHAVTSVAQIGVGAVLQALLGDGRVDVEVAAVTPMPEP